MALGEGWAPVAPGARGVHGEPLPALPQRDEVRLLLPIGDDPATLRIRASALVPQQAVRVSVDGDDLGEQALPFQETELAFSVPAAGRPLLSDVRLRFSRSVAAGVWGQQLSRSGPAGLLARSAGQEAGDFGRIFLDGVDVSTNKRGYNLVALDQNGALLDAANFDTFADPAASSRMAEWIKRQAPGTVIAGAARDEASTALGQEAVDALRSLGLSVDLRGHFRWGHAFITTVGGNAPWWGQTQEASDAVRPVQVSAGLPLSEPRISGQVYQVDINK